MRILETNFKKGWKTGIKRHLTFWRGDDRGASHKLSSLTWLLLPVETICSLSLSAILSSKVPRFGFPGSRFTFSVINKVKKVDETLYYFKVINSTNGESSKRLPSFLDCSNFSQTSPFPSQTN